jgi:hypothetical protein
MTQDLHGIEFFTMEKGIFMFQQVYTTYILNQFHMQNYKSTVMPLFKIFQSGNKK